MTFAFRMLRVGLSFALAALPAWAIQWPQEVTAEEGKIIVYQPQPEKLQGNKLTGRAAMSLEVNGQKDPIFGVFWFDATIDTDRDADIVTIRSLKVTSVRWPESKDAGEQRFTAVVEAAIPQNGFQISFERLSASLEQSEKEQKSLAELNNDPPKITFREQLAVLLLYDAEPRFSPVENSDWERALNTPMVVVRKKGGGEAYLSNGTLWYRAKSPLGPWTVTTSPPQDLVALLPKPDEKDKEPPGANPPEIVTATAPTELIVTQGPPQYDSLPGGKLLYVKNTETPWLRELSTNNMYILLSGRWYRSQAQEGPWIFVRADELPASFKEIPPDSDIGGLRSSIAGTAEATDAVLDSQIPQTAAIKRSEAKLDVQYDGDPKFESIPGTNVSRAVNTGAQVLQINGKWYAADNGVWFTGSSANGPWVVADSVPEQEISKIPPSSPVYNTTYVHVYESTPEVVYVGYTPGYMWSFPYWGVPVYGTGFYYPPYWGGGFYYPGAPTWGFHVGYNPWTGWNFGVSWSSGFFSFGVGWGGGWYGPYRPWGCCGGWYGGGYHSNTVIVRRNNINIGNTVNIGNRTNIGNRINRNNNNLNLTRNNNLYNRSGNQTRLANTSMTQRNLKQARPATNRPNNVFADHSGNIARHNNNQWQTRESGQWNSRPQTRDFDRSGFDRANASRQRGRQMEARRPSSFGGFGGGIRRR